MADKSTTDGVPTTIPVKYSFGGSLRRTTMGFPPKLNSLRKKLARSFPEHADAFAEQVLTLSYFDDENDRITISTNEELLTAYQLAHEAGKVLRFVVNEPTPAPKTLPEDKEVPVTKASEAAPSAPNAKSSKTKPAEPAVEEEAEPAKKGGEPTPQANFFESTIATAAAAAVNAALAGVPAAVGAQAATAFGADDTIATAAAAATTAAVNAALAGVPAAVGAQAATAFGADAMEPLPQRVIKSLNEGTAVHFNRVCSATGACPIFGDAYVHRTDESISLCSEAYLALPVEEMDQYSLLSLPNYKNFPRWLKKRARFMGVPVHPGVTCEATKMKPIIGNRYQLKGACYNLCEYAFRRLDAKDQAAYDLVSPQPHRRGRWAHEGNNWRRKDANKAQKAAVHVGFTCDVSGMKPIVGTRWHKRGHDYDLCDAEYQKLAPEEKAKFDAIKEPEKPDMSWRRRGRGCRGGPWSGRPTCFGTPPFVGQAFAGRAAAGFPGFFANVGGNAGPAAFAGWTGSTSSTAGANVHVNVSADGAPAHSQFTSPQQRRQRNRNSNSKNPIGAGAKFVKDLTVNDRSRKAPGQAFEKAWVMRAGPGGVPAGCTLVFIGGHPLNAETLRVPVDNTPIVDGEEFVLRIPFRAPEEPGHFRSFWRLQTPDGHRFGPRIWADIMVADAPAEATNVALPSMKFVEDVTIPDGTHVAPGSQIRKAWLLSTATGWGPDVVLKCIDVWSTFGSLQEAVPAVPPGSQAEIEITLTAPTKPGHYRTYWALANSDGAQFGDTIFADFVVATDAPEAADQPSSAAAAVDPAAHVEQAEVDEVDAILSEAVDALVSMEEAEPTVETTSTSTTTTTTSTTTATAGEEPVTTTSTTTSTDGEEPVTTTSTTTVDGSVTTTSPVSTTLLSPEGAMSSEFLLGAIAEALPSLASSSSDLETNLYNMVFQGEQTGDYTAVLERLKALGVAFMPPRQQ